MHSDNYCSYFSSAIGNSTVSAFLKLNGTNHRQWVESFMMNLMIMKLDLALRFSFPPKPTDKSIKTEKRHFEEWEYSNRCCLMIIRYYIEDSVRDIIPKIENAKDFLDTINNKYKKFSKNEKNELLTTLHTIVYDGVIGIETTLTSLFLATARSKTLA